MGIQKTKITELYNSVILLLILRVSLNSKGRTDMKDKEATRKKILEEGRKAFIEKGYDNAYLRDIARDAGVTTGAIYGHYKDKDALFAALVRPVLEGLKEELRKLQDQYCEIEDSHLKKDPMFLNSFDAATDYIFDHLDIFILLIKSAHETSMRTWFDDLVKEQSDAADSFQRKWESAGILNSEINKDFISIVTASYYRNIFDAVAKGMDRENMKVFVKMLSVYYTGGWKALAEAMNNEEKT